MKTIAFFTIAVVGVAGAWGCYYYQEFYIPSVYAKAAVPLYQTVPHAIGVFHSFSLSDEENFSKAETILREQCDALDSTGQQLAGIQPSMYTESVHQYFVETLIVLKNACNEARAQVEHAGSLMAFFADFEKIFTIMEDANRGSKPEDDLATPHIQTVGDLQRAWGEQIKAADETGTRAFEGGLTGIDEKTATALTREWGRIEPNLAVITSILENLAMSPSLPIREIEQHLTQLQFRIAEKATRELTESRNTLTKIRKQPEFSISALDIVNFRSLKDVSQTEVGEHLYTLHAAMEELSAR